MTQFVTKTWDILKNHPWLTMIMAVTAQTWFTMSNRALWFSDEVRYADAYQNLVQNGKWMVLSLNGQPYPDKPPVYFWFLWLLDTITPADMPTVFFLGAALSGLFLLGAAYFLARTLGFNRDVSLAAILVLLSNFVLAGLFHYSRMDLMFSALIILSHACLFKAFEGESQGRWPLYALLIAGVATLVKGPLGFIFPLLSIAVYLLWQGRLKAMFSRQMALGLAAMLGILVLWVVGVVLVEGQSFLVDTVIGKHVIQRATKTFHHREPFHYYLVAFPAAWLPWTLVLFVAPLRKLFSGEYWKTVWARRNNAAPRAFLWIMFIGTFVFLSSLSGKVFVYILPMFPPLAIITADALAAMDTTRLRRLWLIIAGLWAVLGLGVMIADHFIPFPVSTTGLFLTSIVLLAGAVALFAIRWYGYKAGLLVATLGLIVWLYPVGLLVAPSMDTAMSPERTALKIRQYVAKGYVPMGYDIYSGIFTYYAGTDLIETEQFKDITDRIQAGDKVVLVIRSKHWDRWNDRPEGVAIVGEQTIAGLHYYLAVTQ